MSEIKNGGLDQYGAEPFELRTAAIWNSWHLREVNRLTSVNHLGLHNASYPPTVHLFLMFSNKLAVECRNEQCGIRVEGSGSLSFLWYTSSGAKQTTTTDINPFNADVPNCCCSKGTAPHWSNPPFLIFDIRALWRSVLSARAPECQKLKMVG